MTPADRITGNTFPTILETQQELEEDRHLCRFCSLFLFSLVSHICGCLCSDKHLAASESERPLGRRNYGLERFPKEVSKDIWGAYKVQATWIVD